MMFFDTETTGLSGIMVLLQYAEDDSPVVLWEVWNNPIDKTLELIEKFCSSDIVGFNVSFDWFHICKIYTTFSLYVERYRKRDIYPRDIIPTLGVLEKEARDGKCLKPNGVFDVMLHARKGPYQSTMDRNDIRVKKVPTLLSHVLAMELERRIKLKDIYFARRKNRYADRWKIMPHTLKDGTEDPDFKDIVLSFNPSNALKALAVDALGITDREILLYDDITISESLYSKEEGYAPYALATSIINETINWNGTWPDVLASHIDHWGNNSQARKYATNDVIYTRDLYRYFGSPEINDDDSILSCLVAACRWKGYAIDIEAIEKLKIEALKKADSAPKAPAAVREYIYNDLSETERIILRTQSQNKIDETTKKIVLEEISKYTMDCSKCQNQNIENINIENCEYCNNTRIIFHPAAIKAQEVLNARLAQYEINFYNKLILAGRFHADFNIIGALSSRMSGTSGLNAQGIRKNKNVRRCFPLAFSPNVLCGGDFISFEVVLADAEYNDPELRKQLLTVIDCPFCNNEDKKGCEECGSSGSHVQTIHALFGTFVYPGHSYVDILKTKGTSNDLYTRAKSAVFAMLYGGESYTLMTRLGITQEAAERGYQMFTNKFKKIGEGRRRIANMFQGMRQPNGIGTRVEWHPPAEYIESMFGFRRYFTLENQICKTLFDMAEKPPKEWEKIKVRVTRRDREQSCTGAVRSALFAAAFNIQGQNTRAAINHKIQSSGAQLTKALQVAIWELQPNGVNDWVVQPMQVHDEVLVVTHPKYVSQLTNIVNNFIRKNKSSIPLLAIDWKENMHDWSEK